MAKQERAVRTRNALIESAAELFTRDGFELASLAGISSRAGVSNGALHFHFASKAALAAAVGRAAAERFERMTAAERPSPQYGGSLQALVDASHVLLDGLAHDAVLRAGFDLSDGSAVGVGEREDLYARWREWVERAAARAGREAVLAGDVQPRDLATAVVGATVGFAALGGHDGRWLGRPTLTRFWTLLLPRVAAGPVRRAMVPAGRRPEAIGGPAAAGGPAALGGRAPRPTPA
ncbi:AcrR family transcriptional regulator [Streptomyces sp. B3I7]|uniref:ScbR family autoregulator-binding transcription factor n=1 Tax=unclassified Streptomyces TaxID=2593676 RepID=UPI00277EFEC3|nr:MULTISPECIES: ScbR family autoregulator-binding transcription factor [unclassified Streptomyces]MDQ0787549.1 AcrR family transcriptional regulator [Streptomyces sp. B3I8]MDQ0812877.1 AcrR family transcriptional regulator [Streptomyces sp. B3I7]